MSKIVFLVPLLLLIGACAQEEAGPASDLAAGAAPAAGESAPASSAAPESAPAAEDMMTLVATADAGRGKRQFILCLSCHAFDSSGQQAGKLGPNLYGVIGRKAGSVEGYIYSDAMSAADIVWDVDQLSAFIQKPSEVVPGTKMNFSGIRGARERAELLAYLQSGNP